MELGIANKLIEKLKKYTDYNINIMDDKGIIIASKDRNRVGKFHKVAYDIIVDEKDVITIDNDHESLGVKSGINMALEFGEKRVGVVGVTGDPREIQAIAQIIRMSLESMIEYEMQKKVPIHYGDGKDNFLRTLLFEDNIDIMELKRVAINLGYREDVLRIPILIDFPTEVDTLEMLEKIHGGVNGLEEQLSMVLDKHKIILFKSLDGNDKHMFADYKMSIGEYLSPFLGYLREEEIKSKIYVGSIQNDFSYYKSAYRQCVWLEENIRTDDLGIYFYDYIDLYIKNKIPMTVFNETFSIFNSILNNDFIDDYIKNIGMLYSNNYHLDTASKKLFIHKNTLAFRINKIRDFFGLNFIQNSKDRAFIDYLYYYLKVIKN